uniref:Sulfotransferase n=1 Tax=Kalanchoe fedtschenkoi TaxID=63787 RepID=A0A7N0VN97_KALFE
MALFGSHIPYSLLPESMIESGCKIVYVMWDPKDVFVSSWHFAVNVWEDAATVPLDDTFDMFCDGFVHCGAYWDHVVEYVKTSLKSPDTILTIAYEDLIERPVYNVKKLANFIGQPFTMAEEDQGVVDEIVSFCSFDKLSNLEVNKTKASSIDGIPIAIPNDTFFRKAKIGDWRNYLDDEKRERIDGITYQKFKDIGTLSRYMGSTSCFIQLQGHCLTHFILLSFIFFY